MIKTLCAASAAVLCAGTASAAISYGDSFNTFGANMPYGSGNANANFAIDRNGSIEIGLKAKEAFVGDLPESNGVYTAQAGSPNSNGLASWNIDFGFALPQALLPNNYDMKLSLDFDPTVGAASFVTLDIDQSLLLATLNVNQGGDSQNPGFNFWSTSIPTVLDASGYLPFDPDALGEYEVKLTLTSVTGAPLAESSIIVRVVPAPASALLMGLGGLAVARRRR